MTHPAAHDGIRSLYQSPRPLKRHGSAGLLCLLVLLGSSLTFAAEAETDAATSAERAGSDSQEDAASSTAARARTTEPAADDEGTFTPSEEISEDFAVSFPVDI
ncbi:MAG: hypothetical protein AAGG11_20645 [Pseudomonadota bacterium]